MGRNRGFMAAYVDYRANLTHFFTSGGSAHTAKRCFQSTPWMRLGGTRRNGNVAQILLKLNIDASSRFRPPSLAHRAFARGNKAPEHFWTPPVNARQIRLTSQALARRYFHFSAAIDSRLAQYVSGSLTQPSFCSLMKTSRSLKSILYR